MAEGQSSREMVQCSREKSHSNTSPFRVRLNTSCPQPASCHRHDDRPGVPGCWLLIPGGSWASIVSWLDSGRSSRTGRTSGRAARLWKTRLAGLCVGQHGRPGGLLLAHRCGISGTAFHSRYGSRITAQSASLWNRSFDSSSSRSFCRHTLQRGA